MKNAMAFSFNEFDALVAEVTYGVVGFSYDDRDGFHYIETMNDDEWDEWLEEYGEEAEEEVNNYYDNFELFVGAMISKKFDEIVIDIIVDYFKDTVVVLFE